MLAQRFPATASLNRVLKSVDGYTEVDFDLLLKVAEWFRANDATGLTPGHPADLAVTPTESESPHMSRFVNDIRDAVRRGNLPARFRPDDVRKACPGWADHTYGVFLPKHRQGNPGGYTAYFVRHADGAYSLIT